METRDRYTVQLIRNEYIVHTRVGNVDHLSLKWDCMSGDNSKNFISVLIIITTSV